MCMSDSMKTKDADIVVICASAKLAKGETRLKLLEDNVDIFVPMIQRIVDSGFDGYFVYLPIPSTL